MWATVHGYVSLEISGMSPHDEATNARLFDEGLAHARRSFELVSAGNSQR
jgi:hypothetical protein